MAPNTVPPSCGVVEPERHPLSVECEVEGSEGLDGVRDRMEEVGVKVEGLP